MELDRAKEIVQALADGVDPYTGGRFPADGPYQRADTARALYAILEAAESGKTCPGEVTGRSRKPPKPVDPNKPRAGGKWTDICLGTGHISRRDSGQAGTPGKSVTLHR